MTDIRIDTAGIGYTVTNNPTSGTLEMSVNSKPVKIYNYCPNCRGEAAPCSLQTEALLQSPSTGRSVHLSYDRIRELYQSERFRIEQLSVFNRNGTWITFDVYGTSFNMTLQDLVNIYKLMTIKHTQTL